MRACVYYNIVATDHHCLGASKQTTAFVVSTNPKF